MLIQCPECKNSISDKANACPHCGAPNEKAKRVIDLFNNMIKCPVCGSTNVMEINAITGGLLGGFGGMDAHEI